MEELLGYPALLVGGAAVLGLLVGSFLNVVILRLPPRLMAEWKEQAREVLELEPVKETLPPSIVTARSACPQCGFQLRWYHNIPLLSFLLLRGRCASCKTPISWQYPVIELLSALMIAACAWRFGPTWQFVFAALCSWLLLALAAIDQRTKYLPEELTFPLIGLGLGAALFPLFVTPHEAIAGLLAGYLSLWFIHHTYRLVRGREGLGIGDFKLLAGLGAFLGAKPLLLLVLIASISGSVAGFIYLMIRRKDLPFAFGPYLAAAGWILLLWGSELIDWLMPWLVRPLA